MMTVILTGCALLAALSAAYCAFADGALLAVDEEDPPPTPEVAALVGRRERAHRALAFARILAQLLSGASAVAALKASAIPPVQIAPLVVAVGILVIVITESAARASGDIASAAAVARHLNGIQAVENLLRPVVALGSATDALLEWLVPARAQRDTEHETSIEQFHQVVAAEAGVSVDDARLLRGVFSLGETSVQDIILPRVDVIGLDKTSAWADVVARVRTARHARYPVYDRTLDNVVGILHAKDLLASVLAGAEPPGGWHAFIRPAQFIPATKPVDAQLRDFKALRRHMAIVVDEFGGTAGIVTLEDALEVIVGDIRDENDVEEAEIRRDSPDRLSVSARLTLDELSDLTGEDFTRVDVHTVGGLVYAVVGGVPRQGDVVTVGGYRLAAERVARRRIERVAVERVAEVP